MHVHTDTSKSNTEMESFLLNEAFLLKLTSVFFFHTTNLKDIKANEIEEP